MMKYLFLTLCSLLFATIGTAQDVPITLEAEDAVLGEHFEVLTDGDLTYIAPDSNFISTEFPGGARRVVSFEITFPAAGTYDFFMKFRIGPQSADDDSFFMGSSFGNLDPTDASQWMIQNNLTDNGFTEEEQFVSSEGFAANGSAGIEVWKWLNFSEFINGETPYTFEVPEGELTQTFQLGAREDGFEIDKIAFGASDLYYTVGNLENGEAGSTDGPPEPGETPPIAAGNEKFLGSAYSSSQSNQFEFYWNQVTPENGGKWGSVEGQRDVYQFGEMDAAYQLAKENGYPVKLHVLFWGSQQPNWMRELDSAEQRMEILEWLDTLAQRYPDIDQVEVVNEPIHAPPTSLDRNGNPYAGYIGALGGPDDFDQARFEDFGWIVEAFRLGREYFPNAELLINDYGIINDPNATSIYLEMISQLQAEGLIDGIGLQCHAFNINDLTASTITDRLNTLAATGLPIYITELDIDSRSNSSDPLNDRLHMERYLRIFPALWEHEAVGGITMWGWLPGLWRDDTGAQLVYADGSERPALKWMRGYVNNTFVPATGISLTSTETSLLEGESMTIAAEIQPEEATIDELYWTVTGNGEAELSPEGELTALSEGTVTVRAATIDGSELSDELSVEIEVEAILGIGSFKDVVIFPNPVVNGTVYFEGMQQVETVNILDLNGRKVYSKEIGGRSTFSLDLKLNAGIYVVQLIGKSKSASHQLLVR